MMPALDVAPIALRHARAFVMAHHRHSRFTQVGWLFGVQLVHGDTTVAVALAGRPVARALEDGRTVEILRVCVAGNWENACSRLYGALCRAATALGYLRAVSYTIEGEPGTSLRAAGFRPVADVDGARSWDTPSRRRESTNLFGEVLRSEIPRTRWERSLRKDPRHAR